MFARFPELEAGTDTDVLDLIIAEAARTVDETWLEQDYQDAIMYLAAHWLRSGGASATQSGGAIKSETFGPISRTYESLATSTSALGATQYGRRFMELRRSNFPAIVVI
jgi:hypothetical protein